MNILYIYTIDIISIIDEYSRFYKQYKFSYFTI